GGTAEADGNQSAQTQQLPPRRPITRSARRPGGARHGLPLDRLPRLPRCQATAGRETVQVVLGPSLGPRPPKAPVRAPEFTPGALAIAPGPPTLISTSPVAPTPGGA